jgi:hypothetical protein
MVLLNVAISALPAGPIGRVIGSSGHRPCLQRGCGQHHVFCSDGALDAVPMRKSTSVGEPSRIGSGRGSAIGLKKAGQSRRKFLTFYLV